MQRVERLGVTIKINKLKEQEEKKEDVIERLRTHEVARVQDNEHLNLKELRAKEESLRNTCLNATLVACYSIMKDKQVMSKDETRFFYALKQAINIREGEK